MGNILDEWKKDCVNNPIDNDYSLPEGGLRLTEEEMKQYREELDNIRENSIENQYKKAMSQIIQLKEEDLLNQNLLEENEISKINVIRAYCPSCKSELTTKFPAMYNPYTNERQCIHHCVCGKKFNLEYAYPRLAFYNELGEEVFVHCE